MTLWAVSSQTPYGFSLMGEDWDRAVPGVEIWRECLRVLKPGAFAFVMCIPRLDFLSWKAMRISDAGLSTRRRLTCGSRMARRPIFVWEVSHC